MSCQQRNETGQLLDALHLQLLELIETYAAQQRQLDQLAGHGKLLLARVRLQQGHHCNTLANHMRQKKVFRALNRLLEQPRPDSLAGRAHVLVRFAVDISRGFFEPLSCIIGTILPFSMRVASKKFLRSTSLLVDMANTRLELQAALTAIERLKAL